MNFHIIYIYIIENINETTLKESVEKRIEVFLEEFRIIEKKLKGIQQRALVELMKIDEIVYYRSIFK